MKKLKKKMEKSDGDENKNMIRPLDVLLLDRNSNDVRESAPYQDFYSSKSTILGTHN